MVPPYCSLDHEFELSHVAPIYCSNLLYQLTLNWDPIQEFNATIDDYEVERAPNRYYGEQLRLSWFDRRARLKSCGFGQQELLAAEHQAKVVRRHREHTERILVTKEHLKIFPQLMAQRINHALHWKKHRIAVH